MCAGALAFRYELVTQNMNWTAAQRYCTSHSSNLVVILDQIEHLALQAYIESLAR